MTVRGNPARHDDALQFRLLHGADQLCREHVGDGVDEPAREIRAEDFVLGIRGVANGREDARLEPREAHVEIRAVNHGAREFNGARTTLVCESRHGGSAGIGEAQKLRRLVEGFARGVVERLPEHFVASEGFDAHDLRVSARDEKGEEGKFRLRVRKARRKKVAFEVMNADHRDFERPGDGVRDGRPHEKGAGKPRAFRHGDAVQVFAALSSFGEDFVGERHRAADVVAAREFGHHASVGAVHVDLSVEGVRKEPFLVRNQGNARFVAGGFDTENKHSVGIVETF